jgi:hypothetical protein
LDTNREITIDVVRKAIIPIKSGRLFTRREKIGRVKKYDKHPAAEIEITIDETMSPARDNSAITIR